MVWQERKRTGRRTRSVNQYHTSAMKNGERKRPPSSQSHQACISIPTSQFAPMNNIEWIFLDLGWTLVDETLAHRADFSKGTYNFEEKRRDAVIVRASDGQGGRVSLDVNIEVTNVDE